ncbi:uncharacterized protein LOC117326345 [Pecten maximus]|uniref:uncharacterized protein LOC117326345 n=1 Tax=Pecten maximus TaxID=6579 RepID=UPI001458B959|nr:uncharacterized protein LOC117326345 [Pecten maximus]
MPPPRKLSTPNEPEHGTMGLQIPTSPVKPSKNETATTFWKEDNEEDIDDDVYEITDGQEDNIYDEPEDIELPRSSKTEHSLKYKTMEFLTNKIKVKDTVQKIKSKITNAMKREKTTTHVHKRDEDEDDGDYEIPDGTLARKTYTRYDTLEKRLTLRQTRNNAYSSLSVSDGIQKHTLFGSLSVAGLANRLVMCGLNDMAEMCLKEKVDGRLFLSLTDDDLREVFSVTELQIKKIHMAQEHDWTPKT